MAREAGNKQHEAVELTPEMISEIEHSEYVPMHLVANWTGLLNEGSLSSFLHRAGVERVTMVKTEDLLAVSPSPRVKRKYERKAG